MNKFEEASVRERFALKQIEPILRKKESTIYYTDIYSYDVYDALLHILENGTIKKRYIIECKLRDTHYDELMYETKKDKDLTSKIIDPSNTDILFINFTPTGTYLFNITQLKKTHPLLFNHIDYTYCPKSTMGDKVYINKGHYLLPTSLGMNLRYIFNEMDFKNSSKTIEQQNNKTKRTYCLFKDVFDMEKINK